MAKKQVAVSVKGLDKSFSLPHEERNTLAESFIGAFTKGKVKYEKFYALRDINIEIRKGEFLGIMGPNGSGKSTLLKLIAGIMEPDRGAIQVQGKLIPLLELGLGFVQELTAKENIILYSSLLGIPRKDVEGKINEVLRFAGLRRFRDTAIKDFSSGMVARLAFAVSREAQGDIYLVDEVLAVGDEEFQDKCLKVFADLKKEGKTVIFVSHSEDMVNKICDKVIHLDKGRIIRKPRKAQERVPAAPAAPAQDSQEKMLLQEINVMRQEMLESQKASASLKAMLAQLRKDLEQKDRKIAAIQLENSQKKELILSLESNKPKDYLTYRHIFGSTQTLGTGEINVLGVDIRDALGKSVSRLRTGRKYRIEISYDASRDVHDVEVGFAITTEDLVFVTGPNTSQAGPRLRLAEGRGCMIYEMDSIPLLPGSYLLHVAITRPSKPGVQYGYSFVPGALRFIVQRTSTPQYGLVCIQGTWKQEVR